MTDLGKLLEAAEVACAELARQKTRTVGANSLTHLDAMRRPHREDGPAVVTKTGAHEWWIHGVRHRIDGPAVEGENPGFFIEGVELTVEEFAAIRKALDEGAPMEWVLAYVHGGSEQREESTP